MLLKVVLLITKFELSELTVPGMVQISTGAELKEQSVMEHFAISDLLT